MENKLLPLLRISLVFRKRLLNCKLKSCEWSVVAVTRARTRANLKKGVMLMSSCDFLVGIINGATLKCVWT